MTVEPREQVALLSQLSISLSLPAFLIISEFLVYCVCIHYPWPVTDSFSQMWLCYVRWWNVHIQHKQLQVTTCNKKRTNNYTRIVFVYTNRSVLLLMPSSFHPLVVCLPHSIQAVSLSYYRKWTVWPSDCADAIIIVAIYT